MNPSERNDFCVIIPARLGSTRLPNKPLADLGGMPMVVHVARRARDSGATRVVVATDAMDVATAVQAHGFHALITAPDHPSGTDRLAEATDRLNLSDTAIVVNVQGDEPLIDPQLIRAVAHVLAQRTDCVMATAAHPLVDVAEYQSPHVVKVVCDARDTALFFSRAPIPWARDVMTAHANSSDAALTAWLQQGHVLRHIGLYAYRAGFLRDFRQRPQSPIEMAECLEQLRALWYGQSIAVHRTTQAPAPGVDTPADLARIRQIMNLPAAH